MRLTVELFAHFRDRLGPSIEVDLPEGATAGDLLAEVAARYPELTRLVARSVVAVDEQFAKPTDRLGSTDKVALIPPISGG